MHQNRFGIEMWGPRAVCPKRGGLGAKGANYTSEGSRRMHPSSNPAAGPTAAKVTKLPPAGREEMLKAAGLNPSARWPEAERWGHGPDDAVDVSGAGEVEWDDPEEAARELEERGYLVEGGWHTVAIKNSKNDRGGWDGGVTSNIGVLHPDEYIDYEALVAAVERELGFTFDEVKAVYRQGPLSDTQRELRGSIDARLLALSRSGANMALLGRVLGFKIKVDGHCRVIENALARARAAERWEFSA